jgi:MFS family permease
MSTQAAAPGIGDYWMARRNRLFLASCIALICTAMSFAIRGDIMQDLNKNFNLTQEEVGMIAGVAFLGFTGAIFIGGPLVDVLGLGRIMFLAFLGHAAGIATTILAHSFWPLYIGTLAIGLGNGCVEAACNPMIATLYPDQKIKRLSLFHVWFPGGIVIGGLISYALGSHVLNLGGQEHGWQIKMATMALPLIAYACLFIGQKFPQTERVAAGISTGEMFKECLRPFFLLFMACMVLTAATELTTGQWIPSIISVTTGTAGILFLVWQNGLMAVGRSFAGPIVHKLSPSGILLFSAIFSVGGIYGLSHAHSAVVASVAVTIFAFGVCFFWPAMLGNVNERFPKTGSLGLALMGGIGNLSVALTMPLVGGRYDQVAAQAAHMTMEQYKAAAGNIPPAAQATGGAAGLGYLLLFPIILVVVFGCIFLYDRSKGGYQAAALDAQHDQEPKATPF